MRAFNELAKFRNLLGLHIISIGCTKETVVYTDGKEYPVVKLEISNTSHPFFTGKLKLVDTAGRVDKFMNKYKKYAKKAE